MRQKELTPLAQLLKKTTSTSGPKTIAQQRSELELLADYIGGKTRKAVQSKPK